uniref:Apple domain-containing protein n=1 Tax=Ditylum brightwellii TaxID=49249 RepID=A0A7S4V4Q2_9STRA
MGDVMLTNSNPNIKQEDNQKILTLASVDVAEGTVTVNLSKSQIGDPFTLKLEPMMAAEVASLNRPVKFTSVKDNSGAHGGHLIIYHTPHVAQLLEGVEVRAFGQSGILGRYPIHFHHSQNVDGSIIRKNVVRDSEQRCIVVHGTNFVMVENNVAYDTRGHCFIAAEDGYETDNTFKDNLGARTKRGVNLPGSSNDLRCSTFWITNPNNYFIGNVAAGCVLSGFWFEEPKQDPVYLFKDNVAHNNMNAGINLYPHGYSPPSPAYFDNLTLYNNGKGMFMKRTKNIRIRNSFFAWNSVGLQYFKNNGYAIIQNTTFHATPPGHADTICPTSTGIDFAYETSGKRLRIKDSSFVGYNNPNCDTVGLALRLVNLQSSSSTSGTLPRLDQVTFDPPGKNSTFGITPDSFFDSRIIILEDSDGSMTGEQGFFVNNAAVGPFSLDVCTSTEGRRPKTMFCAGSCLHTVSIEARELIGGSTKLRVTSRSDSNKTHQFEASGSTSDPAYNIKFSLDLTPSDEYDVSFVYAQTGETVFLSATVTLGEAKGYCEVDDQLVEGSFILPTPPLDSFDLFPHTNATDSAAQSGLATNGDSLYDFDSGDWVTYTGIWFGAVGDTARIRLQFSAFNDGGKIEARLGGVDGEIIGYFYPWNTYGEYEDAAFDIDTDVQGLQQLTFKSTSSSDVMNFTWFELAPECESTGFICLDNSDCCSNTCGSTGFCESPPPSTYFVGYEHRGCSGRNELGTTTKPTVEDCAVACDELPTCMSFEYRMTTTSCQLSSSCSYSLTVPSSDWNFYVKVQDGVAANGNPEGNYYLWLLENAAEISPVELVEASSLQLSMASYYIGYHNGGCVGRNELGLTAQTSVEDCATACDAESTCVSFEYKKGSSTTCQLSSSCDHYSMKGNDPNSDYTWYLNIPDGFTTHTIQGGRAYMWLINVLAPSNMPSVAHSSSPSASPSVINGGGDTEFATYYMGYNTGGCAGRNELGITNKPVVEECAAACDALSTCVSFEYKRSSTACQLSSTCDRFDLTLNEVGNSYHWYLKVNDEVAISENPTPYAYLWLLDNLNGREVTSPAGVTSTNYYIGYNTGGCVGRNELLVTTKPVVEECAAECDKLSACVSFEYKREATNCHLSSTCNDLSLTVNEVGNSYMWYERANSYTGHATTGGNAYLWLMETPTSSPTMSPVTLEPTSIEPTCLHITTGGVRYDDGYLDVFVNTGDGNGYVGVTQSGVKYALNSVVLEKCYSGLVGLQVKNSNANAWAGSIETSVDGGLSYTPMVCKDNCTPVGDSTASIVVDGDANGDRAVKCLNGDTCTLVNSGSWDSTA